MKKYKYLLNMGIAFDEERVLRKLGKLAKEGWILEGMDMFRYRLSRQAPQELVYSMDYREPNEDMVEYDSLFEQAGWSKRCTFGPFHFFSAEPGTVPIYTDRESYISKYERSRKLWLKLMMGSLASLATIALLDFTVGKSMNNGFVNGMLLLAGMLSAGIAVPSVMVVAAFQLKIRKSVN